MPWRPRSPAVVVRASYCGPQPADASLDGRKPHTHIRFRAALSAGAHRRLICDCVKVGDRHEKRHRREILVYEKMVFDDSSARSSFAGPGLGLVGPDDCLCVLV